MGVRGGNVGEGMGRIILPDCCGCSFRFAQGAAALCLGSLAAAPFVPPPPSHLLTYILGEGLHLL